MTHAEIIALLQAARKTYMTPEGPVGGAGQADEIIRALIEHLSAHPAAPGNADEALADLQWCLEWLDKHRGMFGGPQNKTWKRLDEMLARIRALKTRSPTPAQEDKP